MFEFKLSSLMKIKRNLNYKKIVSLLWNQDGSASFNAKGIAFGVFSGCFPFFGMQTFMGLFLAKVFKGNLVLAALGTWISNPFTYLPIYFINYKIGKLLLRNSNDIVFDLNFEANNIWSQGWFFIARLLLGSLLIGLLLGGICGIITYYLYKISKRKNG